MKTAIKISIIAIYIFMIGYETAHPLFDTIAYWIGPFLTKILGMSFTLLTGYCAFRLFIQYGPEGKDDFDDKWDDEEETENSSK